jgi:hypothetical protein
MGFQYNGKLRSGEVMIGLDGNIIEIRKKENRCFS